MRQSLVSIQRIIGEYGTDTNGPLIIFIGGMHGNEPAGIIALQQVLKTLEERQPDFKGKVVALAGNLKALSNSQRFVQYDMNRLWTEERIEELSISPTIGEDPSDDHSEQRELFVLLHNYFQLSHSDIFVIDLHTTSAPSAPFTIVLDSLKNRKLAQYLPVPMVLGMEEHLSGTLMHYIDELGYHTMAFESGQHDDPQSIQNHIAAIWILLNDIGCLKKEDIEGYDEAYEQLKNTARDIAPIFEVRYRYGIMPREKFQMYPGFRNFHPVRKGQPLARNQHGEIYCKETGNIFMPLYQPQGSDGFFIIRRIHPFWIRISQWLRKHRADRLLPLLPGIKRDPNQPEMLIINRKIARWFVVEVLHLLGYRQKSYEPHKLIAVKRKYDLTSSCHQ